MPISHHTVESSHGTIAYRQSSGDGTPIMMIHGNSSCGGVFRNQLESHIGDTHRIIAPDLPGHGNSADATDPQRSYSMEGYADAMTEVLNLLGIDEAIILGWSLGGHIGLEMIGRYEGMLGVMICGSPPVAPEEVSEGFKPSPHMNLAGTETFSDDDVYNYAHSTVGKPFEPFLLDAVARTDGRARRMMFEAFASGSGRNQKEIVASDTPLIAILNGAGDPFINTDFIEQVQVSNLWKNTKYVLDRSGHAPFWDSPDRFNPIFAEFIKDIERH